MWRNRLLAVAVSILMFNCGIGVAKSMSKWIKISKALIDVEAVTVSPHPTNKDLLYIGTKSQLYRMNKNKEFSPILSLQTENASINQIYVSNQNSNVIFVATDIGLFQSKDLGKTWERVFYSSDQRGRICLSIIEVDGGIYLGTIKGIYFKGENNPEWIRATFDAQLKPVYKLFMDDMFVYYVMHNRLYRVNLDKNTSKMIFTVQQSSHSDIERATEYLYPSQAIQTAGKLENQGLILSSTNGIYYSKDAGENWHWISHGLLSSKYINEILPVKRFDGQCSGKLNDCYMLLVATDDGVFRIEDGQATPLFSGMETQRVNAISMDRQKNIYVATDSGVYSMHRDGLLSDSRNDSENGLHNIGFQEIKNVFKHEPNIQEVHRLAISYAEVQPEKIREWRRLALKKAWFPSLDIGVDGGRGWSNSDSLWGSSSSGGIHHVGPDDKSASEDIGWDISLSWDLADLVWSTDQTTIDSRSKLMVELREDILNQITRIYFERRRLQIDILNGHGGVEIQMRIEELTALIDGLTGGEFSQKISMNEGG